MSKRSCQKERPSSLAECSASAIGITVRPGRKRSLSMQCMENEAYRTIFTLHFVAEWDTSTNGMPFVDMKYSAYLLAAPK